MKLIKLINQNFPIWSFLCGDHALKSKINLIAPKLLVSPDFVSPIENALRYTAFKSKRGYIMHELDNSTSFCLVKLGKEDIENAESAFTHISFHEFINKYHKAYKKGTGFEINRKKWFKQKLTKDKKSVDNLKLLAKKIKKSFKNRKQVTIDDVLNPSIRNEHDLCIALNRGMIVKKSNGKLKIVDGTHRIGAWYWERFIKGNKKLPNEIYAFYFEEIQ